MYETRLMLPLDTISYDDVVKQSVLGNLSWLEQVFPLLSKHHVDGVSVDVWWGICARSPRSFDFSAIIKLAKLAQKSGLQITAILSFHQCGDSVGDDVYVPLPEFFSSIPPEKVFCCDDKGNFTTSSPSPLADNVSIAPGLTLIEHYRLFAQALADSLSQEGLLGTVVDEIAIGMGPCGELRYPSYDYSIGWHWPEPGFMVAGGPLFAERAGNEPVESVYVDVLAEHEDRMLGSVGTVFGSNVKLSVKFAGIHWHRKKQQPGLAEIAAGYGDYDRLLNVAAAHGAGVTFTCYDQRTEELDKSWPNAESDPDTLVISFAEAANKAHVAFLAGENSLGNWDMKSFETIVKNMQKTKTTELTILRATPKTVPVKNRILTAFAFVILIIIAACLPIFGSQLCPLPYLITFAVVLCLLALYVLIREPFPKNLQFLIDAGLSEYSKDN